MGVRYSALTALAVGVLACGSGCLATDAQKTVTKKPDVMQPGVLPPPQETTRAVDFAAPAGPVVPASATAAAGPAPTAPAGGPVPPAVPPAAGGAAPFSKLAAAMERKTIATNFGVGWQNRIAYLPDPVQNGRMSPGLVGQMFLYGGPKLEFAQADGVLTVDLVDETPRPAGQPAATPERWQFDKATLRKLQTQHETFGRSYLLFLPWPSYKPDITRLRISARYDPETGPTLYAPATSVTLDTRSTVGTPVLVKTSDVSETLGGRSFGGSMAPGATFPTSAPAPQSGAPIPLGGPAVPMIPIQGPSAAAPMIPIPNGAAPMPIPSGAAPMIPIPNGPIPIRPEGAALSPAGPAPAAPAVPGALEPLTIMLPPPVAR